MKPLQLYGDIRVTEDYAEKYSESTSIKIKRQHWGGESQLSMESVDLDYFKNDNIVR